MTKEEIQAAALEVLEGLGYRDWKCTYAGMRDLQENDVTSGMIRAAKPILWLDFLDSRQHSRQITFRLEHDDKRWVKEEIIRQLDRSEINIRNAIEVEGDVSGLVVGVNTGVINRNFFGGDTYHQVQVYVLNSQGRDEGLIAVLKETPPPYKFLSPYTARDLLVFKGRDDEINQVLQIIHEQRLLVIHGEAGVGKTSLLSAGVIPNLIEEGLLVIQIQDYAEPGEVIYQALKSNANQINIPLPEKPTLPHLLGSIVKATEGTLVLVLDQFELLFETSITAEQRAAFIQGLAQCLDEIPSHLLRVFILIRDEAQAKLWELQNHLTDLLRCQFQLLPLNHDEAQMAIEEPLRILKSQVRFYEDLVESHLVPDLGEMSSEANPKYIHPPHLQIVCTWLYRRATQTDPPRVIDKKMYLDESKGADGIIASYLEETLDKVQDERRFASRVMALMAAPGVERWVLAMQLHEISQDIPVTDIEEMMDILVRAGLLVRRTGDGKYSFISPTVAREILRLAGPEVERRNQAENELERIWLSWLARDAWATREQLRYLATSGTHLTPRAVKSLLLLRSSVERDEPARPWLNALSDAEGRALICQLEELPPPKNSLPSSLTIIRKAAQLLSLPDSFLAAGDGSSSLGPVARNAAANQNPSIRQTCALALNATSADKSVVLLQLEQALDTQMKGMGRRLRRAELRGALADADSEIEAKNGALSRLDRTLIWRWRALRRVARDRRRWIRLMVGGALGAGLALGLLRATIDILIEILAKTKNNLPGIDFGMYFYYGVILGGALSLGMALAKPLLLKTSIKRDAQDAVDTETLRSRLQSVVLSILMGTALFGLAHILALVINGESLMRKPVMPLMGFTGGVGLSAAVYVQESFRKRVIGWLVALPVATIMLTLSQLALNNFKGYLAISWSGGYYQSLDHYFKTNWPLIYQYPKWPEWLALLDAALMGLFLATGIAVGRSQARRSLDKRRSFYEPQPMEKKQ